MSLVQAFDFWQLASVFYRINIRGAALHSRSGKLRTKLEGTLSREIQTRSDGDVRKTSLQYTN
jgi:hypothetical protein